jgi:hypothetical protein
MTNSRRIREAFNRTAQAPGPRRHADGLLSGILIGVLAAVAILSAASFAHWLGTVAP